jgi:hypothetical protein
MVLGAGELAFATPAPGPRAETASAPAMVASAITFFAFIRKPLSGSCGFYWPCWVPRPPLAQTGCANPVTIGRPLKENSVVESPSNPLVDDWGSRRRRVRNTNQVLSRRRARRMSRSFAGVGVSILPVRLRQIAAGAAFANGEWTQVEFALIATEIRRSERHAKFERARRRCIWWLLVAGLALVALNALISIVYLMLSVSQQLSPY